MRSLVRTVAAIASVFTVVCAMSGNAAASIVQSVPEIDASVVPAAMGVVTAGVLMLRARRKSK